MARPSTATVEQELFEKVSLLSPTQKREALDFITFISSRRPRQKRAAAAQQTPQNHCSIDAIFNLAPDCKETDLSINHDKYLYGDESQ